MATAFATDDRFEVEPPSKPDDLRPTARISVGFNLALFGFSTLLGIGRFLASGHAWGPILPSVVVDLLRVLLVVSVTAWFLQAFWRRFIAPVLTLRPIDYQEALAITLMIGILFGR